VGYEALLIACGAEPHVALPGALRFRGPADVPAFARLLETLGRQLRRLTFALPAGTAWTLPAYELALLTASYLHGLRVRTVELHLVTPEAQPLALFGSEASEEIARLLNDRGIALSTHTDAVAFAAGRLELASGDGVETDAAVALPRLQGVRISGVPHDHDGFIDTDRFGRVPELTDVYAAGDVTSFPIKQGGLAAQQAEAAAKTIAAAAGAPIKRSPQPPARRSTQPPSNPCSADSSSPEASPAISAPSSTTPHAQTQTRSASGGHQARSPADTSRPSSPPTTDTYSQHHPESKQCQSTSASQATTAHSDPPPGGCF
jgi:sulfide:quinone oxidoreductase